MDDSVDAVLREIGVDPDEAPAVVLAGVDLWLKENQPREGHPESDLYRRVIDVRGRLRDDPSVALVPVSLAALVKAASRAPAERDSLSVAEARGEARSELQHRYRVTTLIPLGGVAAVISFLWLNEERLRDTFPLGWAEVWFDPLYLLVLGVLVVVWLVTWRRQTRLQRWVELIFDPTLHEEAFGEWYDARESELVLEEYSWTVDSRAAEQMPTSILDPANLPFARLRGAHKSTALYRGGSAFRSAHFQVLFTAARVGLKHLEGEGVVERVWDRGMRLYRIVDPRPDPGEESG